jgi:protein ImuB
VTRYLSLSLPFLATDRVLRRRRAEGSPGSLDGGLATIAEIAGAQRLVAVDPKAAASGLAPGTTLADARAMHPSLVCVASDPRAEALTLASIADWCRGFTPLVALDRPDGLVLDVTGAAHLFGGEAELLALIETRLEAHGFHARGAIASTPEAAWASARHGKARILEPDLDETELARRLGPLPLAALRLDKATQAGLAQVGLRTIADIVPRPRAPIVARFGPALHDRLDGLLGRKATPISPRFEAPPYLAERRFVDGILRREDIEATILSLAHDLCAMLARHGEGARRLEASLFRVDGLVRRLEVGTSRPLRDAGLVARLLHERLEAVGPDAEALDAGYGFDVIRLAALAVERKDAEQTSAIAPEDGQAGLADLVDRLGARLGTRRVTRLAFDATHVPERAVAAVPAARAVAPVRNRPARKGRRRPAPPPSPPEAAPLDHDDFGSNRSEIMNVIDSKVLERDRQISPRNLRKLECGGKPGSTFPHPAPDTEEPSPATLPSRPIRLLEAPEPIETIALVPDGPPLRFRWRKVLHEVAAIEGPERIAPEWWRNAPAATRDYFRAEDTEGRRFWLFREGLLGHETARSRWFMHGFFA